MNALNFKRREEVLSTVKTTKDVIDMALAGASNDSGALETQLAATTAELKIKKYKTADGARGIAVSGRKIKDMRIELVS